MPKYNVSGSRTYYGFFNEDIEAVSAQEAIEKGLEVVGNTDFSLQIGPDQLSAYNVDNPNDSDVFDEEPKTHHGKALILAALTTLDSIQSISTCERSKADVVRGALQQLTALV